MSLNEEMILNTVREKPRITISGLSRELNISNSSMSPVVNMLISQGKLKFEAIGGAKALLIPGVVE